MSKKIVISEFMDETAIAALSPAFAVTYDPTLVDDPPRLLATVADADALVVRNRTQVRGATLAAMRKATVVGRLGVGLDNIDVPGCEQRRIQVITAAGANALSVAEYVICTAMMLLRGAYLATGEVAVGRWPRARLSEGRETAGKTLGIVGFGDIGRLTATLAQRLGMTVLATDPLLPPDSPVWARTGVGCCGLDDLVRAADVLTLHVPLTPGTRNLISVDRIATMKRGAILINTSRGGIVDEAALAAAIRAGALGGAALDVFSNEPLAAGSVWADCPNAVLTPHVAGVTAESNARVSALIAREVAGALGG
jgi:(S)-sulfolactate dehydrogenase